ncbi:MAG TPA: ABC transporter permease [Clostridia bacterium]|nr:ABC transporter permease [Clostridia bacterium]
MVINKKIKRTMLENKSQYLGSLALIIISCLLFTMMTQLADNMSSLTDAFEKDYVQDDATFATAGGLDNIPEMESRFGARIEEGASFDYEVSKDKTLRIFRQNTKVDLPAVIEGKNLSGGDILVDPSYARANGLKAGDELKVLDGSFKISGFMSLPNYIYILKNETDIINDPQTFGIAVIGKDDFDRFGKGYSFYSIKFDQSSDFDAPGNNSDAAGVNSPDINSANAANDNARIEARKVQFRDYLKAKGVIVTQWTDIGDNARVNYVKIKIQGISDVSRSMPVAILLLTCIMTGIVIWRMLQRESIIIGTLYAQGYRRKEIRRHYMMYPLTIAAAGGIIGTALGALTLGPMLTVMVSYFNIPVGSISFNAGYIAASLILPLFFLGVSGSFVLQKALRNTPVDLMKGMGEKNNVNFIERSLKLDRFKFATKFRIREQLRSLSRLAFLLIGVVMATMLLLLGFTAKSSMDNLMNFGFKDTYKFQHEYVFKALQGAQPPAGAERFSAASVNLKSNKDASFELVGIEPGAKYILLKDKSGTSLNPDQVIITRPLAEKLKAGPGDIIAVVGKTDSREYTVTIGSIAETFIGEFIFMPIEQLDKQMGLPAGSYMGLWSNTALDIPENQLFSARTVDDSVRDFSKSMEPIQAAVGIISFMSFIIGLIVIYVVTSLIIEENKGNISLMKVFGYRRKEVNSLILNSSSIMIVIGYIIGIPLVLTTMSMFFKSLTESVKLTLPVVISYPYIIIGFIVIWLTYEISKSLSKRKVNRISMAEALKAGTE